MRQFMMREGLALRFEKMILLSTLPSCAIRQHVASVDVFQLRENQTALLLDYCCLRLASATFASIGVTVCVATALVAVVALRLAGAGIVVVAIEVVRAGMRVAAGFSVVAFRALALGAAIALAAGIVTA